MKVALVIAGHYKHFEECKGYLKSNLLDIYNPDVFIHTYDTYSYSYDKNNKLKDVKITNENFDFLSPKKIVIENSDEISKMLTTKANYVKVLFKLTNTDESVIFNQVVSIRKRKVALDLLDKKYDLVFLIRPDTLILQKFKIDETRLNLINLGDFYQDSFMVGPQEILCELINNINKSFGVTTSGINLISCPHAVIKEYSKRYNPNIINDAWITLLPRDNTTIKSRTKELDDYYKNLICLERSP